MTRMTALQQVRMNYGVSPVTQMISIVNELYDELESRTCENCKHMHYWVETDIVECSANEPPLNWETMKKLSMFEVTYDFGCNKFERKDDGS